MHLQIYRDILEVLIGIHTKECLYSLMWLLNRSNFKNVSVIMMSYVDDCFGYHAKTIIFHGTY